MFRRQLYLPHEATPSSEGLHFAAREAFLARPPEGASQLRDSAGFNRTSAFSHRPGICARPRHHNPAVCRWQTATVEPLSAQARHQVARSLVARYEVASRIGLA